MDAEQAVGRRGFLVAMGQACVLLVLAACRTSSSGGAVNLKRTAKSLVDEIKRTRTPVYLADAHTYLSLYPPEHLDQAKAVYDPRLLPGMSAGLVALHQRCTHLGCRVPFCISSQWFECPCHKSLYNLAGEQRGGPAPRGLDHFPITLAQDGTVSINNAVAITGPPLGTDTTGQAPAGPHCVRAL